MSFPYRPRFGPMRPFRPPIRPMRVHYPPYYPVYYGYGADNEPVVKTVVVKEPSCNIL